MLSLPAMRYMISCWWGWTVWHRRSWSADDRRRTSWSIITGIIDVLGTSVNGSLLQISNYPRPNKDLSYVSIVCSPGKLNFKLPATYWLFNYLRWATPTWRSLFTGHSRRWAGSRIITRISSWRYFRWTSLATSPSFMTISASTPPSSISRMLHTTASLRGSWTVTFFFYFWRSLRSCQLV